MTVALGQQWATDMDEVYTKQYQPQEEQTVDQRREIRLWIEQRRRNYPSKRNLEQKVKNEEELEDLAVVPKKNLSELELKLRKKLKIMMVQIGEEKPSLKSKLRERREQKAESKTLSTKAAPAQNLKPFELRYKRNQMLNELFKPEKDKEASVILQCFRHLTREVFNEPNQD